LIGVGDVNVIVVEGYAKRKIQVIGKDFAGNGFTGDWRNAENIDCSGGGIGDEDIAVGGDGQPSGSLETSGENGDFEAGRNVRLEIGGRRDDNRVVGGAPETCDEAGSVAAEIGEEQEGEEEEWQREQGEEGTT
jgi:hypothetical protein